MPDPLEERLAALEAKIDELRRRSERTMRAEGECRACGCASIIHALYVADHGAVRAHLSVKQSGGGVGEFEVYVCAECGLAEWYVKAPWELVKGARVVEAPEDDGPYR